jgi:hypothetical protein
MLEKHVIKKNGSIGFEEFKMIFFEDEINQAATKKNLPYSTIVPV